MKVDTSYWDNLRGVIRTRKGGWIIGEGVYSHGYSILKELVGKVSYFQMMILNITGKLPEKRLADWVEASFICMSWPDPRLWCNQIGALSGTLLTSPAAAICSGILASDSRMYGPGTLPAATRFIKSAMTKKQAGLSIREIIEQQKIRPNGKPIIPGFGRPLAYGDERVAAMEQVTHDLEFHQGEYLELAYEIQDVLYNNYNETLNLGGYLSAFLRDNDFTGDQIYQLTVTAVNSGVAACYSETYKNIPESFLPLRCDDIEYQGKPPRKVPEKI